MLELEVAIGIEPMNKGFAERQGAVSPSATQYHVGVTIEGAEMIFNAKI
jgi:hypothetical protein